MMAHATLCLPTSRSVQLEQKPLCETIAQALPAEWFLLLTQVASCTCLHCKNREVLLHVAFSGILIV